MGRNDVRFGGGWGGGLGREKVCVSNAQNLGEKVKRTSREGTMELKV